MKKLIFLLLFSMIMIGLNAKTIIPRQLKTTNYQILDNVNSPGDVAINIAALLDWTEVPNATSYIVEASNESTTGFTDVSSTGHFYYENTKVYWFSAISQNYRFFRVISVSDQVATPVFSIAEGTYNDAQTVEITCTTLGTTIRYTTNGDEPTETSDLYSVPLIISSTTTLKAKAFKAGTIPSNTASVIYTITITIPVPANFVFVAGGTFNNGTSDVTISSFYIDKYELTQSSYQSIMDVNPSYWQQTDRPVEQVTWYNSIEYCNKRSIAEGLTPCYSYLTYGTNPETWPSGWNLFNGNHTNVFCNWSANGYRLLTESEWEFAARGGNQTHGYTYSGSNDINAVAWSYNNSYCTTHTVGTKAANELGIYDMSGNVWEWGWDIYGGYPSGNQTNPYGATIGFSRIFRGGSWYGSDSYCTVSYRYCSQAPYSDFYTGFRLCRNAQ